MAVVICSLGYQTLKILITIRPNGLNWIELANMSAIFFFSLLVFDKTKGLSKNIYLIICIILIIFSYSRTVYLSFPIAYLFFSYEKSVDKKKYLAIILCFLIITLLIFINFNYTKFNKEYFEVFAMFKDFILNKNVNALRYYDPQLWSIAIRLQHWIILYDAFLTNNITILFGSGGILTYYESTIFRVLFCTGFVGFFVVLYMIRKLPLYMLIFFIVSGITLDLFLSLKIF